MNKYLEALDRIEETYYNLDNCLSAMKRFREDVEIIRELVDKETPNKPNMMRIKKYDGYNLGICKCGKTIDTSLDDEVNYCTKYGQRIDWGDEE